MAGFNFPGLLSDWTDGMDPQDPNAMPQGLLAALSQAQGGTPISNAPQIPGSSSILGAGGFTAGPVPVDPPPAMAPRVPEMLTQPDGRNVVQPQQPAFTPRLPEMLSGVDERSLPAGFARVGSEKDTTALEGSPEHRSFIADLPSPGATPAGGAPFKAPGRDDPGFLEKLSGVLGGVYGQGGPGDGLINLGLALMSPGNKAENLMRAGQMGQANDYRKSQLLAAQQKQQREQMTLHGNAKMIGQAFPDMTQEQVFAAAQNPALVGEAFKRMNPSETYRQETDGQGNVWSVNGQNNQRTLAKSAPEARYGVIGKDEYGNETYGWISPNGHQVTPNASTANSAAPTPDRAPAIPPAPPGVDPKVWRQKQTENLVNGPKPATENEANANAFAMRMEQANKVLSAHEEEGRGFIKGVAGAVPIVGNYLTPEKKQQYDQSKREFINSVLRKESGASINKDEFASAEKQYFPQPGDAAAVIEQKRQSRQTAIDGMKTAAGRNYTPPKTPAADPLGIR